MTNILNINVTGVTHSFYIDMAPQKLPKFVGQTVLLKNKKKELLITHHPLSSWIIKISKTSNREVYGSPAKREVYEYLQYIEIIFDFLIIVKDYIGLNIYQLSVKDAKYSNKIM